MNRIQLLDEGSSKTRQKLTPRRHSASCHEPEVVQNSSDPCFFVPLHYEPNYAYPLVVWLHGPSDDQQQMNSVMPHISVRNYVGVGVPSLSGDAWGHEWPQTVEGICSAYDAIDEAIAQASERYNVAQRRVFLAGFDRGGTMALRLGLAAPSRFAGAASLGGPIPVGNHPLSNLLEARALPMMIAHGRDSEAYPVERVCEELKLCHAAGISLNLRQYPCEQELTTQMLSDLDSWMMQIVTGVQSQESMMPSARRLTHDN